MSFRTSLLLALALVGVLPVLLLGGLSYRANRAELEGTQGRLQVQAAADVARLGAQHVLGGVDDLQLSARALPLARLEPAEAAAVLQLPFRQLRSLDVLALVDGEGRAVAPPVYARAGEEGRTAMGEAALAAFSAHVPLAAARGAGAAVGPLYRAPTGEARVALAVAAGEGRLLVAELGLGALEERLEEVARAGGRALLLDATGEPASGGGPGGVGRGLSASERALAERGRAGGAARAEVVDVVEGPDGVEYLAAWAPLPELGWGVLVARRADEAFAPADRVRRYTLYWGAVALLATLALGAVLSRAVSRPLADVSLAAARLARGEAAPPLVPDGPGELRRLGEDFNHMAAELARRGAELQAFNAELQRRVDAQTQELRAAQDQVERTRRLAALGSLAAGVAHELNNPLTGVLGLTAVLREEVAPGGAAEQTLSLLDVQAQRLVRVAAGLRQLVEREAQGAGRPFPPARPVQAALEAARPRLAERNVALELALAAEVPAVQGHPEELQELVGHLVQNALTAMPGGGTLTVGLAAAGMGEAVRLWVRDTGRGVPPRLRERIFDPFFTTKDEPGRVGLGLTVCHRIVERHHGRILLESEEGRGSTFSVLLPAAGAAPHLV
jgi:signal transduction histidine kinase